MPGGRADLIVGMKGTVASWCLTWSLGMVGLAVGPGQRGGQWETCGAWCRALGPAEKLGGPTHPGGPVSPNPIPAPILIHP